MMDNKNHQRPCFRAFVYCKHRGSRAWRLGWPRRSQKVSRLAVETLVMDGGRALGSLPSGVMGARAHLLETKKPLGYRVRAVSGRSTPSSQT